MVDSEYIKVTKVVDSNQRVYLDDVALNAAGVKPGDTIEILFKKVYPKKD